jgi:hypothetical protein
MKRYGVCKQYGHFVQNWYIEAESKLDAWNRAEINGELLYQTVYKDISPLSNYVTDIDIRSNNDNTISHENYDLWLEEAFKLGMKEDKYCGLPFNDVR